MANESFRILRGILQLSRSVFTTLEKTVFRICRIYKSSRSSHLSKPMNSANVISKVIAVFTEDGTIELYATFNVICLTCNN